jgi:superoxide dismutase, Cu-Zn family
MDRRLFLVTAAALAALGGGAAAQSAKAVLTNAKGAEIGTVELTEGTDGVLVTLKARHLPAGEHAFHIHAVGKCEPPFTSAGSHFNPGGKKHGMMAAEGQHAGDMPNLVVPKSGVLTVAFVNTQVTLKKGVPNSLYQPNGTAFVIHAGQDDYKTDPSGNAGDRIACAVVE